MALHWLSVAERIQFKLAELVFHCLQYRANQLQPVAGLESRRRLRSSASARLDIPTARWTTIQSVSLVFSSRVEPQPPHIRQKMSLPESSQIMASIDK